MTPGLCWLQTTTTTSTPTTAHSSLKVVKAHKSEPECLPSQVIGSSCAIFDQFSKTDGALAVSGSRCDHGHRYRRRGSGRVAGIRHGAAASRARVGTTTILWRRIIRATCRNIHKASLLVQFGGDPGKRLLDATCMFDQCRGTRSCLLGTPPASGSTGSTCRLAAGSISKHPNPSRGWPRYFSPGTLRFDMADRLPMHGTCSTFDTQ